MLLVGVMNDEMKGVAPLLLRRWLAQGKAHSVKIPCGQYRVCRESLFLKR